MKIYANKTKTKFKEWKPGCKHKIIFWDSVSKSAKVRQNHFYILWRNLSFVSTSPVFKSPASAWPKDWDGTNMSTTSLSARLRIELEKCHLPLRDSAARYQWLPEAVTHGDSDKSLFLLNRVFIVINIHKMGGWLWETWMAFRQVKFQQAALDVVSVACGSYMDAISSHRELFRYKK